MPGLEGLTSIGGNLLIDNNDALTSLAGLDNLNSVGEGLRIYSNDSLTSLSALENLTSVGGFLDIFYNATLISLSELHNLTSVGSYLNIENNAALMSLGLDSLCSVNDNFYITDNPNLCENLAEDLRDQVDTCSGGGIGGNDTIQNNKTCP
jgi:hypothetical protein